MKLKILALSTYLSLAMADKCHISGRCSGGNLVSLAVVESEAKCMERCRENPDCSWITYHNDDLMVCEEYDNCIEVVSDTCQNCITSESKCELIPEPICFESGLCLVSIVNQ